MFTSTRVRENVINRQLGDREPFAAVLAAIAIPGEQVASIQLDVVIGLAIVAVNTDDPGRSNMLASTADPVMITTFVHPLQLRDLQPGSDVEDLVPAAIDRDDLGYLAEEQQECFPDGHHANGGVPTIEYEYAFIQCTRQSRHDLSNLRSIPGPHSSISSGNPAGEQGTNTTLPFPILKDISLLLQSCTSSSSTSKTNIAFGGITPPAPRAP